MTQVINSKSGEHLPSIILILPILSVIKVSSRLDIDQQIESPNHLTGAKSIRVPKAFARLWVGS